MGYMLELTKKGRSEPVTRGFSVTEGEKQILRPTSHTKTTRKNRGIKKGKQLNRGIGVPNEGLRFHKVLFLQMIEDSTQRG